MLLTYDTLRTAFVGWTLPPSREVPSVSKLIALSTLSRHLVSSQWCSLSTQGWCCPQWLSTLGQMLDASSRFIDVSLCAIRKLECSLLSARKKKLAWLVSITSVGRLTNWHRQVLWKWSVLQFSWSACLGKIWKMFAILACFRNVWWSSVRKWTHQHIKSWKTHNRLDPWPEIMLTNAGQECEQ